AIAVAVALRAHCGIESAFLICNPLWQGPPSVAGFPLIALGSRRARELPQALQQISGQDATSVLLQLSPYGFHPGGTPWWLLEGLTQWKAIGSGRRRLLTYFHELYATSAPWRRAFW